MFGIKLFGFVEFFLVSNGVCFFFIRSIIVIEVHAKVMCNVVNRFHVTESPMCFFLVQLDSFELAFKSLDCHIGNMYVGPEKCAVFRYWSNE